MICIVKSALNDNLLTFTLTRLLSAFCAEELTNIYDDEGAYRLLTNEDNVLEVK